MAPAGQLWSTAADLARWAAFLAPDGAGQLDIGTFVFTRTPYDPAADIPGGVDPDGWHAF